MQSAGHDQVEFSYSLWSDPLCVEEFSYTADLPQPNPLYSSRPLNIPQQFRWLDEEELHWQPVAGAKEYELAWLDPESGDWITIYQGSETNFTPEDTSGFFRVRSLWMTPPDDPVYEHICQILVDTAHTIPDIGSVYTLRDYSEDEYVFIVCPEMDANKDGYIDPESEGRAPLGETYPIEGIDPIPPGIREPVIMMTPVTDRWGTWFSATIALYRPDGTRDGYLGVDYPVTTWQRNTYRTQIAYSFFLLVVLAMYFFGVVQFTRLRLMSGEQRKTAEDLHKTIIELTEAKTMAEGAARAKSYFLTNMGHEIRTPLNAVLGFAEIIGRRLVECCPPDQLEDNEQTIALIEKSSSDLLMVIGDILDFSKVDANQVEINHIATEPRKIVEDVYNVIASQLKEKTNIVFRINVEDSVPQWIYSDPTRLRQILGNICGNAVKFSEKGTIRFDCRSQVFENTPENVEKIVRTYGRTVRTAHIPKDLSIILLQFVVQDEGIGISESLRSRVFQPFIQADESLTRKFSGAGLGLAISKHLTELMGGDISVKSEENVGTTFSVTFAVEEVLHPSDVSKYSGVILLNNIDKPLSGMNILVVEDGKVNQIVITKMLQDAGATVQVAENGKVGLQAVEAAGEGQGFDVVLMDMQMPIMDGYEATFRLRQNGYRKPIIAVTAHALTGDCEKTLRAGCNAYLSKPVDRNKLFDLILKFDHESCSLEACPPH
ncbi:MAG: ATP-binding protein [Planctomycetaceae bacterium]|nr:ATP-binding protein [Planctomycetaceae bacterium]